MKQRETVYLHSLEEHVGRRSGVQVKFTQEKTTCSFLTNAAPSLEPANHAFSRIRNFRILTGERCAESVIVCGQVEVRLSPGAADVTLRQDGPATVALKLRRKDGKYEVSYTVEVIF